MKQIQLGLLLLGMLSLVSCGGKKDSINPMIKDITQAVYASGKIYPLNNYKIFPRFPGKVLKLNVAVGDHVKQGDILAVIKNDQSVLAEEVARNQYDWTQRNLSGDHSSLDMLKSDCDIAKVKMELDSLNAVRYANLMKVEAAAKVQYEQAKVQAEIAKQNYLKAKANWNNTRDKLVMESSNARLQMETQAANHGEYVLVAESDGIVYDVDVRVNEMVNGSKPIFELGAPSVFEVELNIDESDIGLVHPDQQIWFTVDAFKDKVLEGRVKQIYPRISGVTKTGKVTASIQLPKEMLVFSGMSVEANIVIAVKKGALVIPREYLVETNKVKVSGESNLVEVKKGVEDLEFVEIKSGITVNQIIEKP